MQSFLTKKFVATASLVAAVLAGSGIAVAYWTSTGSGNVPAAVGTAGTLTLSGTVTSGIVPGGTEPMSFTASNPGTSDVMVGTITLVSVSVDSSHSLCATADFSMANVVESFSVVKGSVNAALPTTGTLSYNNTSVNQNACQGATLTLSVSST